ncbi:uncharacterized protein LOC110255040 [Exaiptasia diaphana]|uniref:CUB domain-containing protein n=1 Tax=Exaiptasia diaphana TaxID=2652724 RepID=A0A913YBJ1_EXADI|nr:uncharacterized protein LOC110255040 [Exaiptasia diaphana]
MRKMMYKFTNIQVVWLLVVLTSSISHAATSCNATIKVGSYGRIAIPTISSYCEWKIIKRDLSIDLSFSDFSLLSCDQCSCEAIEIWTLRPKSLLGRLCGDLRNEVVHIYESDRRILVKYWSKSGLGGNKRYIYFRVHGGIDHQHNRNRHRKKSRQGRTSAITTTAIGILLALVILVGALACGVCLAHCIKPNIRRRRREPSVIQTPDILDGPKLPHLPNYYDNEGAIPPPYLETIGTDGNTVNPPSYECPPPYSILDTSGELETAGETSANDRVNQTT